MNHSDPSAIDDLAFNNDGPTFTAAGATTSARSNAFSNKLTSVLSVSYTDSETRSALQILDSRNQKNTPETRRRLRLDAQKEVIDCNGAITQDFGKVAEVSETGHIRQTRLANSTLLSATQADRDFDREP